MKRLIDMTHRREVGMVDWEFIYEMQALLANSVNPDLIKLNRNFLNHIPAKWQTVKDKLREHLDTEPTVYLAITDVENMGNEFKVEGVLVDAECNPMAFHKVIVYDEDPLEDDFIGTTITNNEGCFSLAFGKKTFSDLGFSENRPDIYFKIFKWEKSQFRELGRIMPEPLKISNFPDKKVLIEFGTVIFKP